LGVYSSFAFTYIAINFLLFVLVHTAITYLTSEYQFGRRASLFSAGQRREPSFPMSRTEAEQRPQGTVATG
ncbi:MAG: hypothetical protein ABI623_11830, partial [bacterium]